MGIKYEQTTIRVERELRKTVKHAATDRDATFQDAVNDGLRLWLANTAPERQPPSGTITAAEDRTGHPTGPATLSSAVALILREHPQRVWIEKLLYVLTSGVKSAADTVTTTLNAFERQARIERGEVSGDDPEILRIAEMLRTITDAARAQAESRAGDTGVSPRKKKRAG
jgi:hypothetical protein